MFVRRAIGLLILVASAFAPGLIQGQAMIVEVIPLKYRAAEQVAPVLQPMLPPGSSVSSFQNQLVVRTTAAGLAEVRRVLATLDTVPRRLLIMVMLEADSERARRGASISGSAGDDRTRVTVPEGSRRSGAGVTFRDGDDRLRARVLDARSTGSERIAQTVQVLEGNSAFIQSGGSAPVTARRVERRVVGGRVVEEVVESTEYRDAATGFHVLPRIAGDRVLLEVSQQREAFSRRAQGAVDAQHLVTTVSGVLGEWIEIGGSGRDRTVWNSTPGSAGSTSASTQRRVLIRVEELR